MKRFAACCLVLALLVGLLPTAVLAAENPGVKILTVAVENNAVNVTGTVTENSGGIYVASYNQDGRQLTVRQASVSGTGWTASLPSADVTRVRAFLLGQNMAPVAGQKDIDVVTESMTVPSGRYGAILITSEVGNGTVILDGVSADNLIVQGGGSHSIELTNGTQITNAELDKASGSDSETPRLVMDATSGVQTVAVSGSAGAIIESSASGYVQKITTEDNAGTAEVKNLTVDQVAAASDVTLTNAAVGTLDTTGSESVAVTLDNTAVSAMTAAAPTTIRGSGSVQTVQADSAVQTAVPTGSVICSGTSPVTASGPVGSITARGGSVTLSGQAAPVITGTASTVTVSGSAAPVISGSVATVELQAADSGSAGVTVADSGNVSSLSITGSGSVGDVAIGGGSTNVSKASGATTGTVSVSGSGAITGLNAVELNASQSPVSLEISTYPQKLLYKTSEQTLDTTGLTLRAIYLAADGTTQVSKIVTGTVSGFTPGKVGTQTITVTYSNLNVTFPVTVVQQEVSLISLSTLPAKLSYQTTDTAVDLTGGMLTVAYTNSALYPSTTLSLPAEGVTVTGFDPNVSGTQTLTVQYSGKTACYTVQVSSSAALESARTAAQTALVNFVSDSDYLAAERTQLQTLRTQGGTAISAAKTMDGIAAALRDAQTKIRALKTAAQYAQEELLAAVADAKTKLQNNQQEQNFSPAAWRVIQTKILTWNKMLDACTTTGAVAETLSKALADLNTVVSNAVPAAGEPGIWQYSSLNPIELYFTIPKEAVGKVESYKVYAIDAGGKVLDDDTDDPWIYWISVDDYTQYGRFYVMDTSLAKNPGTYTFRVVGVAKDPMNRNSVTNGTMKLTVTSTGEDAGISYSASNPAIYTKTSGYGSIPDVYSFGKMLGLGTDSYAIASGDMTQLTCIGSPSNIEFYTQPTELKVTRFHQDKNAGGYQVTVYAEATVPVQEKSSLPQITPVSAVSFSKSSDNRIYLDLTLPDEPGDFDCYTADFFKENGEMTWSYSEWSPDRAFELSPFMADSTLVRVTRENGDKEHSPGVAWFPVAYATAFGDAAPVSVSAEYDISAQQIIITTPAYMGYRYSIWAGDECIRDAWVPASAAVNGKLTISADSLPEQSRTEILKQLEQGGCTLQLQCLTAVTAQGTSLNLTMTGQTGQIPIAVRGVKASASEAAPGAKVTLTAVPSDGTHTYQWYSAADQTSDGTAIEGATASSCTIAVKETAWYSCLIDGVRTTPVKVWVGDVSTIRVPTVANARLVMEDGQIFVRFDKPETQTKVYGYIITLTDNRGNQQGAVFTYDDSYLLPGAFSLDMGETYTTSVTTIPNTRQLQRSAAVPCTGTFSTVLTNSPTPDMSAQSAISTSKDGTRSSGCYKMTCTEAGAYFLTLIGENEAGITTLSFSGAGESCVVSASGCTRCAVTKMTPEQTGVNRYQLSYSQARTIVLPDPIKIRISDDEIEADPNSEVNLSVSVEGETDSTYQWYVSSKYNDTENGTPIDGGTSAKLAVNTAVSGILYYYCIVDDAYPSTVAKVWIGTPIPGATDLHLAVQDGIPELLFTEHITDRSILEWYWIGYTQEGEIKSSGITFNSPDEITDTLVGLQDGTYSLKMTAQPSDNAVYRSSYTDCSGQITVSTSTEITPEVSIAARYDPTNKYQPFTYYLTAAKAGIYSIQYKTEEYSNNGFVMIETDNGTGSIRSDYKWLSCSVAKMDFSMSGDNLIAVKSNPASVAVPAEAVGITASASASEADPGVQITLTANVTGLTDPQYQWYSNTTDSTKGGTAIENATGSTYTFAATAGITYYYCVLNGNAAYTSNTMKLHIGTLLPTVTNIQLSVQDNGRAMLSCTLPEGVTKYRIEALDQNGQVASSQYSNSSDCPLEWLTQNLSAGTYQLRVVSVSTDAASRENAALSTATVTVQDSQAATPAPVIAAQKGPASGQYQYQMTPTASGYYSMHLSSDTYMIGIARMVRAEDVMQTLPAITDSHLFTSCQIIRMENTISDGNLLTIKDSAVNVSIPLLSVTASATAVSTGTSVTLTADASGLDVTSWQWYSNTIDSTEGGTAIENAKENTYTFTANTSGTTYYYCVINENGSYTTSLVQLTVTGT